MTEEAWILRILNRLSDIRFTYILLRHNYNSGIPDQEWYTIEPDGTTNLFKHFSKDEHLVKNYLFNYYCEYIFYLYFALIDITYKYLNIHFDLLVPEGSVRFNKDVMKLLKNRNISTYAIFHQHLKEIKKHRTSRNLFTHDFPENKLDLRPITTTNGKIKTTTFLKPKYTASSEMLARVEELIKEGIPILNELSAIFNVA